VEPVRDLYVFIDESGNFDFSPRGSRYFVLAAVVTEDPVQGVDALLRWRHHVLAGGGGPPAVRNPRDCTYFHCSEDEQYTRSGVFSIIASLHVEIHSVVVEKSKAKPSICEQHVFYQRAFRSVVPSIVRRRKPARDVHIFVSQVGVRSKKSAIVAALKETLNRSKLAGSYRLYFHPNHSHHMLQVSDYVCWAIARAWEHGDRRSYTTVAGKIVAERELFARGKIRYY